MDKNKIKVALLGLGRIGQMHAKNLIENREFKLKYIFDLNKDLLKKIMMIDRRGGMSCEADLESRPHTHVKL